MSVTFTLSDAAISCAAAAFCSSLSANSTSSRSQGAIGATAGATTTSQSMQASATALRALYFVLDPAGVTAIGAGNWTVNLDVTVANSNLTWTRVTICRVNSSCVSQATVLADTTIAVALSTTGTKSTTQSGLAATLAAGDLIVVILGFTNGKTSAQAFSWKNDLTVVAAGAVTWSGGNTGAGTAAGTETGLLATVANATTGTDTAAATSGVIPGTAGTTGAVTAAGTGGALLAAVGATSGAASAAAADGGALSAAGATTGAATAAGAATSVLVAFGSATGAVTAAVTASGALVLSGSTTAAAAAAASDVGGIGYAVGATGAVTAAGASAAGMAARAETTGAVTAAATQDCPLVAVGIQRQPIVIGELDSTSGGALARAGATASSVSAACTSQAVTPGDTLGAASAAGTSDATSGVVPARFIAELANVPNELLDLAASRQTDFGARRQAAYQLVRTVRGPYRWDQPQALLPSGAWAAQVNQQIDLRIAEENDAILTELIREARALA